jgi:GNAT superfamily N-acetyltransferase
MVAMTHAADPFAIRGLASDADYEAIAAVMEASRVRDGLDFVRSADQVRAGLGCIEGFDPADGIRLAEVAGVVVGFAYGFLDGDSPTFGRILYHSGRVVPAWRGRGIGRALLAEAQAAAVRHAARRAGHAPRETILRSFVDETDHDGRRVLEDDAYAVVRYGFAMVRPSLADPPPTDLPPDIEARPTTPATALQVLRAMNEAMADHWGMADYSDDDLRAMSSHPLMGQLDVWQVAWEGDEVVGGVLGFINAEENRLMRRARGYTENIFTRRPWRGRGVASALIGRNLLLLAQRGMTEAALNVDAENPTGALALYERLGFVRHRANLLYQRPLRPRTSGSPASFPVVPRVSGT